MSVVENWKSYRLADLATFHDEQRVPIKSEERASRRGDYPYYGASGQIDVIDDYIFDGDYVLLAEDGANILDRNSPIAFHAKGKFWVNNHAHILKANGNTTNEYLVYALESIRYEKYNSGSAQPKLNRDICENIKLLMPPKGEQQKIVEILSDCDTAIEHVKQQASLLTQVTNKSIKGLAENVGEPTKLSELCSPQQWQTIGKSELLEEGIPVFGANGYIGYFSEANHYEDTIAVTCRGATSGEVSWVKGPAYITGNAMCLDDVDESQISKRYLYYQLGLGGIKKIISGSAQPQIIGEDISRFKVFVPNLDYQNMALQVFEAQASEISLLRKQITLLEQQKRGLMQQLLTGKLRVKGAA